LERYVLMISSALHRNVHKWMANRPCESKHVVDCLLQGDYKQSDYGKVILPFTVLRRLDCVLEPTKEAVLAEKELREGQGLDPEPFLVRVADQDNIGENLCSYIQSFTPAVRDIFESFEFHLQVDRLEKAGLPYQTAERFAQIDLHPETVSNAEIGLVFEELIRKFAELSGNGRRALHATGSDQADGEPDLHRRRSGPHQAWDRAQPLRSHRGHRRHVERGRGAPGGHEPCGPAGAERPGAQPGELRDLQVRHVDQEARHPLRQHAFR
jgi:hypothetical protein